MFFIAGGKKGLPWGALRTHKDISAAKSDEAISQFCLDLIGTEYEPISNSLSNFLFTTRNRKRVFGWGDYYNLYQDFENVLHSCRWTNDRCYDWCSEITSKYNEFSSSSKTLTSSYLFKQ